MASIAYLDNGPQQDRESGLPERIAASGHEVERFWAYRDEFPKDLSRYAGVVLSGSPLSAYDAHDFIRTEHALIAEMAERQMPVIGLCFGSQILGSALCGRDQVFRRKACEVGYATLSLSPAGRRDSLTKACGATFEMFVWHNDEVRADHEDMVILASTSECPNHVWRYRDLPIWGIQGHPEVTRVSAPKWFERSRRALAKDGADASALIAEARDSEAGLSMLDRFVEVCKQPQGGGKR